MLSTLGMCLCELEQLKPAGHLEVSTRKFFKGCERVRKEMGTFIHENLVVFGFAYFTWVFFKSDSQEVLIRF